MVLSKNSRHIRNSYEIRLCLYFAAQDSRALVLAVRPGTLIDQDVSTHIAEHGGRVVEVVMSDFSVYFGALDSNGKELDGWVLGNSDAWLRFRDAVRKYEFLQELSPGQSITSKDLLGLKSELTHLKTDLRNVDDENLFDALRDLVAIAEHSGGTLFVQ